jgi:hypothetical protein
VLKSNVGTTNGRFTTTTAQGSGDVRGETGGNRWRALDADRSQVDREHVKVVSDDPWIVLTRYPGGIRAVRALTTITP